MLSSLQHLGLILLAIAGTSTAFTCTTPIAMHRRSSPATLIMMAARRGRGMGKNKKKNKKNKIAAGPSAVNWVSIPGDPWDLTTLEEGKVQMFDTNLVTLTDKVSNPDGAVSILKTKNGEIFCFSSYCPCCKFPMTKANVVVQSSSSSSHEQQQLMISCSFCKSVYDLRSGIKSDAEPATNNGGGGLFAGLAQNLFKATGNTDPLTIYPLGEKDGKTFIGL